MQFNRSRQRDAAIAVIGGGVSDVDSRLCAHEERLSHYHAIRTNIRRMQRAAYSLIFVAVEQELAGIIALDDTPRAETGGWVC